MWRRRSFLLLGLGALATLLLAAVLTYFLLGVGSTGSTGASTPSSGCSEHFHPIGTCSVPNGGSIDPCSIVTAGITHCPFSLPDLNPADWLGWLGCAIVQDANVIWNAIVGDVSSFLLYILNGVTSAVITTENTVLGAIQTGVIAVVDWAGGIFTTIAGIGNTLAQGTGPFAPLIATVFMVLLFTLGFIAIYFAFVFGIALGKTIWNLL